MAQRKPRKSAGKAKPGHRPEVVAVLTDLFSTMPEVKPGKMFGYPAFYTDKKLFACVFGDGVALRLPAALVLELRDTPGFRPFQPVGEPDPKSASRGWLLLCRKDAEDYRNDLGWFVRSIHYARSLNAASGRVT